MTKRDPIRHLRAYFRWAQIQHTLNRAAIDSFDRTAAEARRTLEGFKPINTHLSDEIAERLENGWS